jgi:polyhydroxyalkanoate synthase
MEDYRELGIEAAIAEVALLEGGRKIHAAGYCLGGTLLAIAAAALGPGPDNPLASLTLFTAQVDFTDPGELQLFIDESQVSYLEALMSQQGYLRGDQMAGAFQLLRSNDLIWSHLTRLYLRGERETASDLMAWNADVTRMPARMHSEYLRWLFLRNDLAEGRYQAAGRRIALSNIELPTFMVATETDHVAPWRSVYKLHFLTDTDLTFLLTSGGHNAGIVSEPGHPHRHYRVSERVRFDQEYYVDPDAWFASTPLADGSWWPVWVDWLTVRTSGWVTPVTPKRDLGLAPGRYVLEK